MCVFSLLLIKKLSGLQTKEIPNFLVLCCTT